MIAILIVFCTINDVVATFLQRGWTPLIQASYRGKRDLVKLLMDYDANPNLQAYVMQHNMFS